MQARHRLLQLAGFDPEVVRALGPGSARGLRAIALAHALPSALMGAGAGYAVQLVEGVLALSLAACVAFGLFVLNLLRVAVAGSGMAPRKTSEQAARFRPAMPPVIVIGLLATLLAQPAILPLFAGELEPQIAAHRAVLLREHAAAFRPERVTERSQAGQLRRERAARFTENVTRASFAAERVTRVWRAPLRPAALTLAFVLLCLSPLLLARTALVSALRHYELVRRERLQVVLVALESKTAAAVHAALARYPSYERGAPERPSFALLPGGVA